MNITKAMILTTVTNLCLIAIAMTTVFVIWPKSNGTLPEPQNIKVTFNGQTAEQLKTNINAARTQQLDRRDAQLKERQKDLERDKVLFKQRLEEHYQDVAMENEELAQRERDIEKNAQAAMDKIALGKQQAMAEVKKLTDEFKALVAAEQRKQKQRPRRPVQRKSYTDRKTRTGG